MSNKYDRIEDYPLFYEEIGPQAGSAQTPTDTAYDRLSGINDEQLAKLSEDMQSPLKNQAGDSNPIK